MMWFKEYFLKITLVYILSLNYYEAVGAFKCIVEKEFACTLHDLNLNETHPYFLPVVEPSSFNGTIFQQVTMEGTVAILTNDVCTYFRSLLRYFASGLGLIAVHKDAFEACFHLEELHLRANQLTKLDFKIFSNNLMLLSIDLSSNQFQDINPFWFNSTPKIGGINLRANRITNLPIDDFPVLRQMTQFYIFDNQLTDLNETIILMKFPFLQWIEIDYNFLSCSRQNQLKSFFEGHQTKLGQRIQTNLRIKIMKESYRILDHAFEWVRPNGCIADQNWNFIMREKVEMLDSTTFIPIESNTDDDLFVEKEWHESIYNIFMVANMCFMTIVCSCLGIMFLRFKNRIKVKPVVSTFPMSTRTAISIP